MIRPPISASRRSGKASEMTFECGTHHVEQGTCIRGISPQMCPGILSAFVTDAASRSMQRPVIGHVGRWARQKAASLEVRESPDAASNPISRWSQRSQETVAPANSRRPHL